MDAFLLGHSVYIYIYIHTCVQAHLENVLCAHSTVTKSVTGN